MNSYGDWEQTHCQNKVMSFNAFDVSELKKNGFGGLLLIDIRSFLSLKFIEIF